LIGRSFLAQAFALVILATMAAHAQVKPELVLRQLEQDAAAASVRNDTEFFDRVLAPDWTGIDVLGRQIDKPMALAAMKSKKVKMLSLQIFDVQIRFLKEDVAVVTGRVTATATFAGKAGTVKSVARFTDIFAQQQGKWIVMATQATPVKGG